MHILHISWEYPPRLYGGLGRHVHALAEHQALLGHDVTVLTQRPAGLPCTETVNGVDIVRVTPPTDLVPLAPPDLVDWARALDRSLAEEIAPLGADNPPDLAHAHDWVVTQAAVAARKSGIPLVSTIHATEGGRHQGWITNELSRRIHNIECTLTAASDRVVVCSRSMRHEVETLFDVPETRIAVISNGIDLAQWQPRTESTPAKGVEADSDSVSVSVSVNDSGHPATVVFTGRLEWEKGVHVLLEAADLITLDRPGVHFLIAGTGTREEVLKREAAEATAGNQVTFLGRIPEIELVNLVATADVAVVPSIYEPFGLVALEAAALGTPLVVSDTGGLADLVDDQVTGRVVASQDSQALADAILETLSNKHAAIKRAEQLRKSLPAKYDWSTIAQQTVQAYELAIELGPTAGPIAPGPTLAAPADHNLFTPELRD